MQEVSHGQPHNELTQYLQAGPKSVTDIVHWWGVCTSNLFPEMLQLILSMMQHQENQYPTLQRMACDYLTIQGSSTPSEWAFSSGGLTVTAHCN